MQFPHAILNDYLEVFKIREEREDLIEKVLADLIHKLCPEVEEASFVFLDVTFLPTGPNIIKGDDTILCRGYYENWNHYNEEYTGPTVNINTEVYMDKETLIFYVR